jgi:imidazolonepropionase-like amidohydrolase
MTDTYALRLSAVFALSCAGACGGAASDVDAARPHAPRLLAIVGANVVTMTADTVLFDHTVIVEDGIIARLGPSADLPAPAGAAVIDATGEYLAPGLVDAHVHLRAESELRSYLRHGVTTVLNMRGTPVILDARAGTDSSVARGPRILTSGPLLDGDPPIWSGDATRILSTEPQVRDAVAEHVRLGYDFVKVYNNLEPSLLGVVVREARAAGFAVVGHLPRRPARAEGLTRALAAGIALIAHGEEIFFTHFGGAPDSLLGTGRWSHPSDSAVRHAAERIRVAGAAVTPNLSFIAMTARMLADVEAVFADPEFARLDAGVQDMWRAQNPTRRRDLASFRARERVKYRVVQRLTKALADAGVPLMLGTDASAPGMYPGASAHVELAELVAAGLSPYEALVAGTSAPGRFLARHVSRTPRIGEVAPGFSADLVLLDRSPLDDLSALATPRLVLRNGLVAWERP